LETLHDEEQPPVRLANLVQLTEVRMIDASGESGLAPKPGASEVLVALFASDDLYRNRPGELLVEALEDNAHPAFAQDARHSITADVSRRRIVAIHGVPPMLTLIASEPAVLPVEYFAMRPSPLHKETAPCRRRGKGSRCSNTDLKKAIV
jgi:hypothetical protein